MMCQPLCDQLLSLAIAGVFAVTFEWFFRAFSLNIILWFIYYGVVSDLNSSAIPSTSDTGVCGAKECSSDYQRYGDRGRIHQKEGQAWVRGPHSAQLVCQTFSDLAAAPRDCELAGHGLGCLLCQNLFLST